MCCDRKRAEAALCNSQKRLSLLIQETLIAVSQWSTKFLVRGWNPATEKIFGYTVVKVMGCPLDFMIAST